MTQTATQTIPIDARVSEFLSRKHRMLIGGKWVEATSGKTFDAFNPATGEILARVPAGDANDIDLAVKAARTAFESPKWRSTSPAERTRLLWRLAELIEKHGEELAQIDTLNNGMPIAAARGGIPFACEIVRYNAGWATKLAGETVAHSIPNAVAYTLREPIGVVGQIIPWNVPMGVATQKIAPAIAAGCTIVLKPAEQTPLSALRLGELIVEAGFPDGVVNIVTGLGETTGAALASHPDVEKIAFTGSTATGKLVAQAALGNLKRVTLELGGKSPTIVFDDADLQQSIPAAAIAIFANAGQVCTAGSRLYVHRKIFDKVAAGVADAAKKIALGPGLDPNSQMGPLISQEQHRRVLGYLDSASSEGAETITGGRRWGDRGYFVQPTVITKTHDRMKVVREEIFGPVVCAIPFEDPDEIVRAANDTPFGLAAAVFTRDVGRAHRIVSRLGAGTVWVNAYHLYDVALPFGGYKQSGWGREFGREGVEIYTELKSVIVNTV